MRIERLTAQSAAQLSVLHAASFDRPWSEAEFASLLHLPSTLVVGGWTDEVLTGFAMLRCAADEAEILTICVAPEQRANGAGRSLLEAAEREAGLRGVARVFLEVAVSNQAARALYSRAAYAECGRREAYYADGDDALVLEKSLSGSGQTAE